MKQVRYAGMDQSLSEVGLGTAKFGSSFLLTGNGTNNRFSVTEGFIEAVKTNSYANLILSFSDGAGIAVDATPVDSDVAMFGLFSPNEEMFAANGTIKVRLDGADALIADGRSVRVPVCTVAASTPDLTGMLVGVKPGSNYACHIEKETLVSGLTRYTAVFASQGFVISFR